MNSKLKPLLLVLLVLVVVNAGLVGIFLWQRARARDSQGQAAHPSPPPLLGEPSVTEAPPRVLTPMEEIHEAARNGNVAALRVLLDAHPELLNANTHNRFGSTALHFAAFFKQQGIVEELIKRGANVNAVNKEGTTPLHDAISANQPGIARLLLDAGADLTLRNGAGKDALTYAQDRKRTAIVEMIQEKTSQPRK